MRQRPLRRRWHRPESTLAGLYVDFLSVGVRRREHVIHTAGVALFGGCFEYRAFVPNGRQRPPHEFLQNDADRVTVKLSVHGDSRDQFSLRLMAHMPPATVAGAQQAEPG